MQSVTFGAMGCDIHACVETGYVGRDNEMSWSYLCDFRFGRNYTLFALMAGVRRYGHLPDAKQLEAALAKRGVDNLSDPFLSEAESELIVQEASDTGITHGQPSFDEKGMPRDIDWKTAELFLLNVLDDDDPEKDSDGACSRTQAESWIKGGSSEVWDEIDGKILRITHPDHHTASWLDTSEMATVAKRYRVSLEAEVPERKRIRKQNIEWAKKGLASAKKAGDAERIAMMERELKREKSWAYHTPMNDMTLGKLEGLVSMMSRIERDKRLKARVLFWFDN